MDNNSINSFLNYCKKHIKGDEKGEAQLFLDHFFQALGYANGLKDAGADCEFRIKDEQKHSTQFADLVWKPVVLIEMKKRGVDLSVHYQQAFDYWTKLVPNRPQYVILCNFDEFWIYNLNLQVYEPLEKVSLVNLIDRKEAFSFLLPSPKTPIFNYNKENVTETASGYVAHVFRSLTDKNNRGIKRDIALRYCMQMVLCMFAEDVDLLPSGIFSRIIKDLLQESENHLVPIPKSYDLIGGLFREMNTRGITSGGMYKGVDYFNGGLFETVYPIELTIKELQSIDVAASKNWKSVNPAIFGSIFESSMDEVRHKFGAHYTHEIDIKKIVVPVIVQPWQEKINKAHTLDSLYSLLNELANFKVLDPACGSGNFLFIAFKEMKLLEKQLLQKVRDLSVKPNDASRLKEFLSTYKFVTTNQFYGLDVNSFAVELAKVTLMIAKEMTCLEMKEAYDNKYFPLPLDNLDQNIICMDALLNDDGSQRQWPEADAIVGNPPYQSKNKMQKEFGVDYINRLRAAYPEVPGRADFCVYWFYKAHKHLKPGCFAGLVGTNTIRQNFSREGSLDYIVNHGGTIIDAVSSQEWSGEAAVFVSIVNWLKGTTDEPKNLWYLSENNEIQRHSTKKINSSLSPKTDVTAAKILKANTKPKKVFQGQTHGHDGFLLPKDVALKLLKKQPQYAEVLKPFLIGDELVSNINSQPERFVIDFTGKDLMEASSYKDLIKIIEKEVLPEIQEKAELEKNGKIKPNGRMGWLNSWWLMWRRRENMLKSISSLTRYISCARVTKRPIFEFISSDINPNDKLMCFSFNDDYSFGVISSSIHWFWFTEKCTTLGETPNYNSAAIWDTFPWPQNPTAKQIEKVAKAAKTFRTERKKAMETNGQRFSLRDIYRILEKPGKNPLKELQQNLDTAVLEAYGFSKEQDVLQQLLDLNLTLADKEAKGETIQAPGVPAYYPNIKDLVSTDCVKFLK